MWTWRRIATRSSAWPTRSPRVCRRTPTTRLASPPSTSICFTERGFHGSRGDYYNRSNSYLSEVIDDREGLPITLSVLYIELARRLGVRLEGVGLPGHFVVRHVPAKGEAQLIDVYEGGQPLTQGGGRQESPRHHRAARCATSIWPR